MQEVTNAGADERAARRVRFDLVRALRGAVVVASAAYLVVFLVVAVRRIGHPFELEWMEGAMVTHVDRILHGQKLYVRPTIDFVPFIYGPVYFYLAAAFAKVMGVGFAALRLVSSLSTLGSFAFLGLLVARETSDRVAGVATAGAFAASYVHGAQFLDLARVDALALFFSLAAIHLLRHHPARLVVRLAAALLLGLSFMTKQSMLFVAMAMIAWEIVRERRRAIPFVAATIVFTFGAFLFVDWLHDGWFRYYVWELPRGHALVKSSIGGFWSDDLFPAYGVAFVAAGYWLLGAPRAKKGVLFYLLSCGALVAGAYVGRLHDGGWPNVLIPAFAALSIFFGLGLAAAFQSARAARDVRIERFVLVAALTQLAVLAYDVKNVLPKPGDVDAGRDFVARLRSIPGDVFVPSHAWYAHLAGKRVFAHRMALDDVMRGDPFGEGADLVVQMRAALAARRWSAFVIDDDYFEGVASATYVAAEPPFAKGDDRFFPVTGIHIRPTKLYVRK